MYKIFKFESIYIYIYIYNIYIYIEQQAFYIIENNHTKQVERFSATQAFYELKS